MTDFITPKDWLPPVTMKRIVTHWTAGHYIPSEEDLEHYHFIIDGDGKIHRGEHKISANIPPLKEGMYAAHTRGANSYTIGVSLACMALAKESPFDAGVAPMLKIQWTRLIEVCAQLATYYRIPVTPTTILSHAEVQTNLGIPQRQKWDYTVLPFDPSVRGAKTVGDRMRSDILRLMK